MVKSREAIAMDVMQLLEELASDWEYAGALTPDTRMLTDMGMESLDLVVLATALQERYEQELPFSQFFTELGQRNAGDLTVREWIDFMDTNLNDARTESFVEKPAR
jgi:acyl carrier protein